MGWAETANFHDQLAVMLDAGLPIARAVQLAGEGGSSEVRALAPRWSAGCGAGRPLAEQLKASRQPPFEVAMVTAGERCGQLPQRSREVAAHYRHLLWLRRLMVQRLSYPLIVVHIGFLVVGILAVFLRGASPWILPALPAVFWLLVGCGVGAFRLTSDGLRARLALSGPLLALTMPRVAANTCTLLRATLSAGLGVHEAFALAAGACGNALVGERLARAGNELRLNRIESISVALSRCGLPALVIDHVHSGELAGTLEKNFGQAAKLMQESFEHRAEWTAKVVAGVLYAAALLSVTALIFYFWITYARTVVEAASVG